MASFNYSLSEKIYNACCLLITKIFYRSSRLIRCPITVRGKQYINFGKSLTTGRGCQLEVANNHDEPCLLFGDNVNIGHYVRIQCIDRIRIGSNVLMGSRVTIIDHSHGLYKETECDAPSIPPNSRQLVSSPIEIGNNVWIGEGAIIQQGVTIGDGSIIGANSVVVHNIPAGCMVGGIPARIVKRYDEVSKKWVRTE